MIFMEKAELISAFKNMFHILSLKAQVSTSIVYFTIQKDKNIVFIDNVQQAGNELEMLRIIITYKIAKTKTLIMHSSYPK